MSSEDKIKIIESIMDNGGCNKCLNPSQNCVNCLQQTITLQECLKLLVGVKER